MKCTARLTFSAGGNRPRLCDKPATYLLSDGTGRCSKHRKGRGQKLDAEFLKAVSESLASGETVTIAVEVQTSQKGFNPMTIENDLYGGNWHKCVQCGVKDRGDQLMKRPGAHPEHEAWAHIGAKAKECSEWKTTLERAKPADIDNAALKYKQPTADELLAEVNTPKPTVPELRRRKRESAELKAWAAAPWVNPHDKGGK